MSSQRSDLEQAIVNNVKVARNLIRLRKSIEADEELNRYIPRLRTMLEMQAQNGAVIGLNKEEQLALLLGPGE